MEMKLTNGFNEMNQEEMMNVDGGIVDIIIIGGLICGVAAFEYAVTAVVVGAAKDLENCYNNGYNEVMISAK